MIMTVQGAQLGILQTIADVQVVTSLAEVEDRRIAEETDLDVNIVRSSLNALAEAGYVQLEKLETLSGMVYNARLTPAGETALTEG
jgi:transcription initiation factor IIE alpha subunit